MGTISSHDQAVLSGDDYEDIVRCVKVVFWSAVAAIGFSHALIWLVIAK